MSDDKVKLYGGGGMSSADRAPLTAEERHSTHRMLQRTLCHDCHQMIEPGSDYISSSITVRKGIKAQNFSYPIHIECYEILSRVMQVAPISAEKLFGTGRKPLWEIYKDERSRVDTARPELGAMLALAFKDKL